MNIETRKLSFIEKFIKIQNTEIISKFEKMLYEFSENTNAELMTSYELNQRIKVSMEDSKNEMLTENEELVKEIEGWS